MSFYTNPIARHGDFADPFALRFNGRYYLYCTNEDARCWSSSDLVDWRLEGPTVAPGTFGGLVPFAPEVTRWGRWFYMYTSPSGTGHMVLRSATPTGPFEPVSGNLGHAIDGHVFTDDDGRHYFYWAGEDGIWASAMKSPTQLGPPVATGAYMDGWTEGPFVVKHDGFYHMTYTGNHYLSPGYRISAAVSEQPLRGYRPSPRNPLLVSADGPTVGLGHSSTVLGPDLVSRWLLYHNLNPDRSRDLNIDRLVIAGDAMSVMGPSHGADGPAGPDFATDWAADELARWRVDGGELMVTAAGDAAVLCGESVTAVWEVALVGPFTSEHTFKALDARLYGVVGVGGETSWAVRFDVASNAVAVLSGGVVLASAPLPPDYAHDAHHCCRLVCDGGLRLFVDDRAQLTVPGVGLPSRLGYEVLGGALQVGYTAVTERTEDALDQARCPTFTVEKFPKKRPIWPILREFLDSERGTPPVLWTGKGWRNWASASCCGYGKRLLGPCWSDATIEAELRVVCGEGHGDLLLRASQLADGGEGDDPRLGSNFLLGYSVQLHSDRVVVARHAYDERMLADAPLVARVWHRVRVEVRGARLSVVVDGRQVCDLVDEWPHLVGNAGLRAVDAAATLRALRVVPVPAALCLDSEVGS